ncbi:MAG: M3 family oligoendopeptidase [Bacteroidetes bacterium]|nr:MAG: M3 family oligoendopeptidase [Bacteroidota bacterium]PTM14547.1 MAG: M3 family oligoendopeptidase [Bacteroidota bacterium]
MKATAPPRLKRRTYLPSRFRLTVWDQLAPFFEELRQRELSTLKELEEWLLDRSELDAFISESFAWRYINISSDSSNEQAQTAYQQAVQELSPRISDCTDQLNRKLVDHPMMAQLDPTQFGIYLRAVQNQVNLFREENIALETEVQLTSKDHGKIFSKMTIAIKEVYLTLQKAGTLLEEPDRNYREGVYHKINQRILQDSEELEDLFDQLRIKRHQIARNAGFDNFRDYHFRKLGRFDYTPNDCFDFHDAIQQEIRSLVEQLYTYRKEQLHLDRLRPWDLHVDTSGKSPLRPFQNMDDLVNKATICLQRVHPQFGEVLTKMREMGHLDLDSRPGKRPGGYTMPLLMTGVPFIFMNASRSLGDMRTLLHECGHAVHSYLTRDLPLSFTRRVPSEVAELAAMTMELLTMDYWDVFFPDEEDLRRAKIHQLETVLKVLPWIATIDKFQHWIYTHPEHNREERKVVWTQLFKTFNSDIIDHEGIEEYAAHLWHKQLHLFEVPFYYIEYGIAQLGAIAIWKQYRSQPAQTVERFRTALRLGYTRSISEIYHTAGIEFNFSREYLHDLGQFVKAEIDAVINS